MGWRIIIAALALPALGAPVGTAPSPAKKMKGASIGTTSSSTSHTASPFSAFTKSLPQEKRKPFMELMKRLRGAKAATVGTKEEKKKVMGSLDSDIHKLLGSEYKRYRTVQHAQHEMHTALKKGTPPASTLASPPPPASTAGKKKSGLPGMKKKKVSSTSVG